MGEGDLLCLEVRLVVGIVQDVAACATYRHLVDDLAPYMLIELVYLSRDITLPSLAHQSPIVEYVL